MVDWIELDILTNRFFSVLHLAWFDDHLSVDERSAGSARWKTTDNIAYRHKTQHVLHSVSKHFNG
jgi:hypothetical protein